MQGANKDEGLLIITIRNVKVHTSEVFDLEISKDLVAKYVKNI